MDKFKRVRPDFIDFRDASYGPCSYKCTLLHCFRGLVTAIKSVLFNFQKFDLKLYECMERVQNGDMSWIIPGKLLAFSGPSSSHTSSEGVR